jgi:integrase
MANPFEIKKRSTRGGGSLFEKPVGNGRWHISYYVPQYDPATGKTTSKRIKEYCGLSKKEAQTLLNSRMGDLSRGKKPDLGRRTVGELYYALHLFVSNNLTPGSRKAEGHEWRWKHLSPFFAHLRAPSVTAAHVEAYKAKRKAEGAANATVNRELATLRKLFRHARKTGLFSGDLPVIEMFSEACNTRIGFVEQDGFQRLAEEAVKDGLWMRLFVELAYTYGWRHGELLGLRVRHIDLAHRTIRLDPGTTKNGDGREVYIGNDNLLELLRAACEGKGGDGALFTRDNGRPVLAFQKAWRSLCVRAGVGRWEDSSGRRKYVGLIPHDFRRSAAKALRRAGVPESVIMATGGWKTASMFRRYAIVSGADQKDAMLLLQDARRKNSLRTAFPTTERETKEGERIQ